MSEASDIRFVADKLNGAFLWSNSKNGSTYWGKVADALHAEADRKDGSGGVDPNDI